MTDTGLDLHLLNMFKPKHKDIPPIISHKHSSLSGSLGQELILTLAERRGTGQVISSSQDGHTQRQRTVHSHSADEPACQVKDGTRNFFTVIKIRRKTTDHQYDTLQRR